MLSRFYDQLCVVVEQQRLSDPACLAVVHRVKALMEAGVFLHKPLLAQVAEHVAKFLREIGLLRHNPRLLPVFTYIRMCVGASEGELVELAKPLGLLPVLYSEAQLEEMAEAERAAALAAKAERAKRVKPAASRAALGAGGPAAVAAAANGGEEAATETEASGR